MPNLLSWPLIGKTGLPLKDGVLEALVELLSSGRPVLHDTILLSQQLVQNCYKLHISRKQMRQRSLQQIRSPSV